MTPLLQELEDKYEVLQKLKEGGMGAIYKVRHRLLSELRVVKVMRPHLADDPQLRTRFVHEAKLAIKVRHPNIAQLYDFSMDADGTAIMILEYIDGITLEEMLSCGSPPSVDLAVEIALQALQGLGCLHRQGIIHRDISTDNLMLTLGSDGGLVKLIDLGIAKDLLAKTTQTVAGTFLGKAHYSAPEQFRKGGSGALGPSSDIYSFGVVLYELLTGRRPVEGEYFAELVTAHLMNPPLAFEESDPRGRVPPELRKLVLDTLAKSPKDRPASVDAVIERLLPFRPSKVDDAEIAERVAVSRNDDDPRGATWEAFEHVCALGLYTDPATSEIVTSIDEQLRTTALRLKHEALRSDAEHTFRLPAEDREQPAETDPEEYRATERPRPKARKRIETRIEEGERLAADNAHRKAIRVFHEASAACREAADCGDLLPGIEHALEISKSTIQRQLRRLILFGAGALVLGAGGVTLWQSMTDDPLQREFGRVLGLPIDTAVHVENKLDELNTLLAMDDWNDDQRRLLNDAKERVVVFKDYRKMLENLVQRRLSIEQDPSLADAENTTFALWNLLDGRLDQHLRRYPGDAAVIAGLKEEAEAEMQKIRKLLR